MNYPSEVQALIDDLAAYKENDKLELFDLVHMYPDEIAYPNGYYDSRFFVLWGYNEKTHERRNLGTHDGIRFVGVAIDIARIFADGSTLLRFQHFVKADLYACVELMGVA